MPRSEGTDVSKWQGAIDWRAVQGAGVWWAATRVWDRDLRCPDATFAANRAGMAFARHRLLYYWLEPGRAQAGVSELLDTIGTLQPGEGVMLDAEEGGITEGECLQWLEAVEAATGLPCAVYTGGYVAGGAIWRSTRIFDGRRARVFAAYCSEADAHHHAGGIAWDAWQWTSTGTLPGVSTGVDLDQVDNAAAFDRCVRSSSSGAKSPIVRSGHAVRMP